MWGCFKYNSYECSLVADKLRTQDITGAGDALSSALFVATIFGVIIQAVLLVHLPLFATSVTTVGFVVVFM